MSEIGKDGEGLCPQGVHQIDAAQRDRVVAGNWFPAGFHVAILDGEAIGNRETFFSEIARALRFPDYFGHNWDAVYDCLTDPSLIPGEGCVLVLDGCERLARNEPGQWQIAMQVFRDACAFWRPLDRPMCVLLYDPDCRAPGVLDLPAACLPAGNDGE